MPEFRFWPSSIVFRRASLQLRRNPLQKSVRYERIWNIQHLPATDSTSKYLSAHKIQTEFGLVFENWHNQKEG
jgi:hypothetical protein